jgi:acetyltransferase-like isoleucine patch superfamily enzyme
MAAEAMPNRFDFLPWLFWSEAGEAEKTAQLAWQARLAADGRAEFQGRVYISQLAAVHPERLELGEGSYIAAHAYVTDDIRAGSHCTFNPFCVVRGKVRLGTGVRIGAHSSILGFNHGFEVDRPVYHQPLTIRGITIGDDVWIGSQVVILDGVTIGDHVVIGAGSIVTKDIPSYSVAAGNPARLLRDRRTGKAPESPAKLRGGSLVPQLRAFGEMARREWAVCVARCWDGAQFLNAPGAPPAARAWCDAVEIASMFGALPTQLTETAWIERLRAFQDPQTGLCLAPHANEEDRDRAHSLRDHAALYHTMAVGYALDNLGVQLPHPIPSVAALSAETLRERLEALPWKDQAWAAGDWIDCVGTALWMNQRRSDRAGVIDALLGWLVRNVDPLSGLWGSTTSGERRLQPVNGFYRLTRGTFAQFSVPLPRPVDAIDSVLAHTRDETYFRQDRGNACNVLDTIHPLWLCLKQTNHRRSEAEAWAETQIQRVLDSWQPGAGFSFELDRAHAASLMGTEMWLSILWYAADLLSTSESLGYQPQGIHRPTARVAN